MTGITTVPLMLMDAFNFYTHFGYQGGADFLRPKDDGHQIKRQLPILSSDRRHSEFNKKYLHDSIAFWNEMFAHPYLDDWWKAGIPEIL